MNSIYKISYDPVYLTILNKWNSGVPPTS